MYTTCTRGAGMPRLFGRNLNCCYSFWLTAVPLICLLVIASVSVVAIQFAGANQISVYPTDIQTYRDGDVITVTERVHVSNGELSPLMGVTVLGGEAGPLKGQLIYVGLVQPEEDVESTGAFTFTVDLSQTSMRSFSFPVTVQYTINGEPKEVQWGLSNAF